MQRRFSRSHLIALLLLLAVVVWMASGVLAPVDNEGTNKADAESRAEPTRVQVRDSKHEPVQRTIVTQANVLPTHRAIVRAETAGRVVAIEARAGERLTEGQLIVRLSLQARESRLKQAEASLQRYAAELAGARRLAEKDFTPRQRVRELEAQVAAAEAEIAAIRQEIEDASIGAPFAGVLNDIAIEPGEYLAIGAEVATMIDNDPIWARAQVSQQSIGRIDRGSIAAVTFATGAVAKGRVCFISAAADVKTRTFPVEIRVSNPDHTIPSGISAEVRIPTGKIEAHKVSPALLSLGREGDLGIKTVSDNRVKFHPVEIALSSPDGVWVTGLPPETQIITVGQGFVRQGDVVETTSKPADMPGGDPDVLPSATTEQAVDEKKSAELTSGEPPPCVDGERPDTPAKAASR